MPKKYVTNNNRTTAKCLHQYSHENNFTVAMAAKKEDEAAAVQAAVANIARSGTGAQGLLCCGPWLGSVVMSSAAGGCTPITAVPTA